VKIFYDGGPTGFICMPDGLELWGTRYPKPHLTRDLSAQQVCLKKSFKSHVSTPQMRPKTRLTFVQAAAAGA
jgi:hypothetical protein